MKQAFVLLLSLFLLVRWKSKEEKVKTTTAPAEPVRIVAIGRVEPEQKITSVGSEVNGVIKKIYVSAGDKVRKGQVLIEFAHDYEDAKLLQTKAKETTQKAEIQNAQAQINAAKIKSENLRKTYERTQKIFDEGAETKQVLENTKTDYDQASKDVERFTASLNSAESKLNEIKADV
jgi:macrolide-specific efflux system membrane fusion protein